ncbi:MAG: molybdenum cofactor biosynthesis protein MoaE [Acidimicrobiia bacterium]|nr:molybdenum cofactor biosynthesis protein MoaE [Acidimicrobiia bacterium]
MATSAQPDPKLFRWVEVTAEPLDAAAASKFVGTPESGAAVVFLGTVRNHAPGKTAVSHLEYEAYEGVVEPKIDEIVAEAMAKWPLHKVAALHRVGELAVGEISVIAAASSAHRADAFEGARYVIDQLKVRAPIWKKEHWPGGAEWVREDLERSGDS